MLYEIGMGGEPISNDNELVDVVIDGKFWGFVKWYDTWEDAFQETRFSSAGTSRAEYNTDIATKITVSNVKNETSGSRIDIYKEGNIGSILSDGASPYVSIDVVFTVGSSTPSSTPSPNPTPSMNPHHCIHTGPIIRMEYENCVCTPNIYVIILRIRVILNLAQGE